MKQRLISVIRRQPAVYRASIEVLSWLQSPIERWRGTSSKEKWWSSRTIGAGYWANRDHPSKHFLADRISSFSPINSMLEIGCASGPNLFLLSKRYPKAQLAGIDINQEAVEYGNQRLTEEGVKNVRLSVGKADALGQFPDKSFDLVFTDAVLIYIGPDRIEHVLKDMLRVSRKGLVLMELQRSDPHVKKSSGLGICQGENWVRDYTVLLEHFVSRQQIRVTRIPEEIWPVSPWKEFGAIIEVTLRQG